MPLYYLILYSHYAPLVSSYSVHSFCFPSEFICAFPMRQASTVPKLLSLEPLQTREVPHSHCTSEQLFSPMDVFKINISIIFKIKPENLFLWLLVLLPDVLASATDKMAEGRAVELMKQARLIDGYIMCLIFK